MDYREKYKLWCEDSYFDEDTKKELHSLTEEEEIKDRFYKELEFGTGGLRGVIGAGSNRMNVYTVRKATQGLANFILQEKGAKKGVVIAYDSRRMSKEYAEETALCFCANEIQTYLFDSLRPTPELSFAVRELGAIAGVVITASHNPPEYNGYKVYWQDGAQITYPKDEEIIGMVNDVTDYKMVLTMSKEDAQKQGLLHVIGESVDASYMEELKKLVVNPLVIKEMANELKIVYTPIHGSGNVAVRRILKELGFTNVYVVKEQEFPDGEFPTVSYPNPEDPAVFELAKKLAKEIDADLILATDPDADRLGAYVKNPKTSEYEALTGNMSGILICEYLLSQKLEKGILPKNAAIVKTIVTTDMADLVAKEYAVNLMTTLTGFKYIGEQIKFFEQQKSYQFEFGFEESYGCLVGTHARDKDAVVAVMALCEAAAYYKSIGISLWEQMIFLYEKYGYYREDLGTITFKGEEGSKKIANIVQNIRENPPKELVGYQVETISDYLTGEKKNMKTKEVSDITLPKSNVVYFELSNDAWFCVRPSGTEPKIKFYYGVKGSGLEDSFERLNCLKEAVWNLAN